MKKAVICCSLVFLLPLVCRGGEGLKAKAGQFWAGRQDPKNAALAVELYEQLAKQDPQDLDSRIRLAEAVYWMLEQDDYYQSMTKDKKVKIADKGVKACREVLAQDEDNPGANYWLMWDMAARTLNKGIFSGFALKDSIVCTIMVSKADVNYEHGGVYRYWARVIFEIPGILGRFFHFTDQDPVWLYRRAIAVDPTYLRNHFWLAESYQRMDRDDLAKKEYEFCAGLKDAALPENQLYKKWAQERLAKM